MSEQTNHAIKMLKICIPEEMEKTAQVYLDALAAAIAEIEAERDRERERADRWGKMLQEMKKHLSFDCSSCVISQDKCDVFMFDDWEMCFDKIMHYFGNAYLCAKHGSNEEVRTLRAEIKRLQGIVDELHTYYGMGGTKDEAQGHGADIAAGILLRIIKDGRESGGFSPGPMEDAAQAILELRDENERLRKRLEKAEKNLSDMAKYSKPEGWPLEDES